MMCPPEDQTADGLHDVVELAVFCCFVLLACASGFEKTIFWRSLSSSQAFGKQAAVKLSRSRGWIVVVFVVPRRCQHIASASSYIPSVRKENVKLSALSTKVTMTTEVCDARQRDSDDINQGRTIRTMTLQRLRRRPRRGGGGEGPNQKNEMGIDFFSFN